VVRTGFRWGNLRERTRATPKRRLEDNTKTDFKKIGIGDVGLSYLVEGRDMWRSFVIAVMNPSVP
jgi:hypothetical protein